MSPSPSDSAAAGDDRAAADLAAVPKVPPHRSALLGAELASLVDVVGPVPLVDLLLERAFELGATDIHLDPREDGLHVRIRLDGLLHDILTLGPELAPQVVSRLKLLARMDITERRLAQDGHIGSSQLRRQRDIRVGSCPTIHGERLVLRLMPDAMRLTRLEELGLTGTQRELVESAAHLAHGMMLCVGPVGCGKSTTTYACLNIVNDPVLSVTTIEDPVERRIPGVNQVQIDPKIGFGFPQALRGVLRQDPNVMMVGEIRDSETAHIAVRAGLTGIRVFSTMHASRCASVIDVFREFEIPPMFIADAVNCIIAQRLVRKVCPQSREYDPPDEAMLQILGVPPEQAASVRLARGVPADCNYHTGYVGRTGVFEVMRIDAELRRAILSGHSAEDLHALAARRGMTTLEQAAIQLVLEGVTSVEEMHRVLML
jgi:type II secretory ATPase GspE/PulE/Tfp pilus assembly ATPase PilB-like protein